MPAGQPRLPFGAGTHRTAASRRPRPASQKRLFGASMAAAFPRIRRGPRGSGARRYYSKTAISMLPGVSHRYTPGRGIWVGICRSVGAAAADRAARGPGNGGSARGLPRCGGGGDGGRATGSAHALGCRASLRRRIGQGRCRRRGRRDQPGTDCPAAWPGGIPLALRRAGVVRHAAGGRLAVLAGAHQSGRPDPAGAGQVAQPAP